MSLYTGDCVDLDSTEPAWGAPSGDFCVDGIYLMNEAMSTFDREPEFADCQAATASTDQVNPFDVMGQWVCARSSEGRFARVFVVDYEQTAWKLTFELTVWE